MEQDEARLSVHKVLHSEVGAALHRITTVINSVGIPPIGVIPAEDYDSIVAAYRKAGRELAALACNQNYNWEWIEKQLGLTTEALAGAWGERWQSWGRDTETLQALLFQSCSEGTLAARQALASHAVLGASKPRTTRRKLLPTRPVRGTHTWQPLEATQNKRVKPAQQPPKRKVWDKTKREFGQMVEQTLAPGETLWIALQRRCPDYVDNNGKPLNARSIHESLRNKREYTNRK